MTKNDRLLIWSSRHLRFLFYSIRDGVGARGWVYGILLYWNPKRWTFETRAFDEDGWALMLGPLALYRDAG